MEASPNVDAIRSLAHVAEAQHGAFSLTQAETAGMSRSTLWDRIELGLYRQFQEGVFLIAGTPDSWHRRVVASVLSEGDLAAASHETAALLLGLIDRRGGDIHVVTKRWMRRPRPEVTLHESNDLVASDIVVVDGIPTTNVARTVVDLGATARWLVPGALGHAVRSGQTDLDQVEAFVARVARRGRRGVGVIRPIIRERRRWERRTESELEDQFVKVVRQFDLPEPVAQFILRDDSGDFVCRADFAYPSSRVLVELDGYAHHSDEEAFQKDRTKQNRAQLLGWSVLRYTWRDVVDRPATLASEISAVLA